MKTKMLLLPALLLLAAPALAVPHLTAVGSPCGSGCEPTIFDILDTLYGSENYARVNDEDDQLWTNLGARGAEAKAKFSSLDQTVGFLDGTDVFHPLFFETGSGYISPSGFSTFTSALSGSPFRWANQSSGFATPFWTSFEGNNVDPGGVDHMITFRITGGSSAGNYVIGVEDLPQDSDRDFNDIVFEVSNTISPPEPSPVPEPGTATLVALGLAGIASRARRRRT